MKTLISKELSSCVKAIAISMVVFEHIARMYFISEGTANYFGVAGVCCFLILSGYGLYVSYTNNGLNVNQYISNKLNKVFIPYSIITIIYFFIFIRGDFIILVKNILCIDYDRTIDGTMWYMSFLLLWYLLFLLVFYFKIPNFIKIMIMFGISYYFKVYSFNVFSGCSWQFVQNAYSFPIGILIAYIDHQFFQKTNNKKCFAIIKPILIVSSVCLFILGYFHLIKVSLNFQSMLIFIFVVCSLSYLPTSNIVNKIIKFIGTYSFVIYLLEGKLIMLLGKYNIQKNGIIFTIAFIAILAFMLFVYEKIKYLFKIISNKKKGI